MGGSNETKINGLRMHVNETEKKVHIHDDNTKLKFSLDSQEFKAEVKDAFALFKDNQDGGLVAINGDSSVSFILLCAEKNISTFLIDGSSCKKDLDTFIKGY